MAWRLFRHAYCSKSIGSTQKRFAWYCKAPIKLKDGAWSSNSPFGVAPGADGEELREFHWRPRPSLHLLLDGPLVLLQDVQASPPIQLTVGGVQEDIYLPRLKVVTGNRATLQIGDQALEPV